MQPEGLSCAARRFQVTESHPSLAALGPSMGVSRRRVPRFGRFHCGFLVRHCLCTRTVVRPVSGSVT